MTFANKQRGLSLTGFIFVLIVVGLVGIFTIKIAPMYIEFRSVKAAMDQLAQDSYTSPAEVRKSITKRLETDYVSSVKKQDITISPQNGGYDVVVDYYVDSPLFYNLTISGHFEYAVQTK